ncbi:MAG TPA: M1 family peptidase, partial [Chitinophagaceae bacterium]
MKYSFLAAISICCTLAAFAQDSKYDQHEAFNPVFYTQSGNEIRTGSGEPGPKYWQNRADYKIDCTLDTATHRITSEVEITYTNNSPDNLKFLWLQLDQNIYRNESRASYTTTEAGGRWANAKFTQGDVIKSVEISGAGKS